MMAELPALTEPILKKIPPSEGHIYLFIYLSESISFMFLKILLLEDLKVQL